MKRTIIISLLCLLCGGAMQAQKIRIKTGIEVLKEQNFRCLEGKRVGLITNPTGVDNRMRSTIDILHEAPNVNLVALYGPEHGVRGDVHAGDHVTDIKDATTGLPVYSLYGKTRKATPDMLKDVDVLVYDIQDIGCRSFTYISTMGLAMEAAAENGKEFIVLDRPNPVGGLKIEGNLVEDDCISFVSQFKIPYLYALTCGELALMLNGEKMLKDGNARLIIPKPDCNGFLPLHTFHIHILHSSIPSVESWESWDICPLVWGIPFRSRCLPRRGWKQRSWPET